LFDSDTLKKIAKGDSDAFAVVYKQFYKPLCIYAYRFFQDEESAEDVVQKTLIKVWEQRSKITKIQSLSSFLYRSVHNHSINELKHRQVVDRHSDSLKVELDAAAFDDVDDEYEERISKTLLNAIESLPPKKREIFKLKYFKGLKHKEIADLLGISYRTVETHIVKGLQKLRDELDQRNFIKD
jgi:RNA polymerase sigma-70 factor, ECF subfamily